MVNMSMTSRLFPCLYSSFNSNTSTESDGGADTGIRSRNHLTSDQKQQHLWTHHLNPYGAKCQPDFSYLAIELVYRNGYLLDGCLTRVVDPGMQINSARAVSEYRPGQV